MSSFLPPSFADFFADVFSYSVFDPNFVTAFLAFLLPEGSSLPAQSIASAYYFGDAVSSLNTILPVTEITYLISFVIFVESIFVSINLGLRVLSFIRGFSIRRISV